METYDPKFEEMKNNAGQKLGKIKRFLKHTGVVALLVILIPVLGMGGFYNIEEQEQAVVTTFGMAKAVTEPGLHFKIPLIQRVKKVNTTIQGFAMGYNPEDNLTQEEDSLMITSDYNFVNVDFFVEYKVADPVKAVYASQDPVLILRNMTQSCIRTVIGGYDVDSVLTTGKNEIQSRIKEMIIAMLEQQDIGLQIVNVTIQDSEPPTQEVMEAFKAVETAKQGKETAINNANKYRNEKLPQAEAKIDQIMQEAESGKVQRINEANAEVAKFNAMYAEYVKNPEVTKKRMFYEAMEDILPGMKVIIDGTDKTNTILPLDSFTGAGSADSPKGADSKSQTGGSSADGKNSGESAGSAE
ncbi:MAG: FtsH protease activity modulator HflK [Lachnospiraceae bacterium]|nr:FtsH protease activity modulator HflK [Lachnospiraceae bacterium]